MSLDLMLLPFDNHPDAEPYSHTVLSMTGAGEVLEALQGETLWPVPNSFTSYVSRDSDTDRPCEDAHYGRTVTTAYKSPLRYATAGQLAPLVRLPSVQGTARHRAIWAYLAALPPDTKVALYWC
jgi:hypothetical protein